MKVFWELAHDGKALSTSGTLTLGAAFAMLGDAVPVSHGSLAGHGAKIDVKGWQLEREVAMTQRWPN